MKKDIISKRYFNDGIALNKLDETQTEYLKRFLSDERIKYEIISVCPLCKSEDYILIAEKDRYAISLETVVCERCGLVRSLKQLNKESNKIFYSEYYSKIYDSISNISVLDKTYEKEAKHELPTSLDKNKVILELGCSGGWNLMPFFLNGYKHYGFDFDKNFIEYGKKKGLNLYVGGINEAVKMGVKCDYLILSHVLEHIDNPVKFLTDIKPLLNEDAIINIYIPSLGLFSQGHHAQTLLETLQNAHNFLFDDFTLKEIAKMAGFKVVKSFPTVLILKYLSYYFPSQKLLSGKIDLRRGEEVVEYIKRMENSFNMIFRPDKVTKEKTREYLEKSATGEINPIMLYGAFGDMENCTGIVEEQIFPKEGGAYLKLLGCNYLLKGCPMGMIYTPVLESLGLAKATIMQSVRIISESWFLKITLFFLWLLRRRKFYYFLNYVINIIHGCTVGVGYFEKKRYNKFATEIRRAFLVALKKEINTEKELSLYNPEETIKDKKLRILIPMVKLAEMAIFLIDFDTAYRFQSQDGLSNLDKNNNDSIKELDRILGIMQNRYQDYVKEKISMFRKPVLLMRFVPLAKRILKNFFEELDIEKVKLDEADWYYCLRRSRYNFAGLPIEERLKMVKDIDKEQGNIRINFKVATEEEFKKIVKRQKKL